MLFGRANRIVQKALRSALQDASVFAVSVLLFANAFETIAYAEDLPQQSLSTENVNIEPDLSTVSATDVPSSASNTQGANKPALKQSKIDQNIDRTLFDIYVADSFQGGVLVNYTDQWIEIESPADIIEQIKDLQNSDVSLLTALFEGRIEGSRIIEGVGSISYDIYTFRLLIKLDQAFLKSRAANLTDKLPDPERGFSIQQNLAVAASGEVSGESNASFSHRSLFGSGRYFGRLNGTVVQNESYELTEASALGYVGDYELGGGFLETPGQSFANSLQYTGLRLKTSDQILLDPERSTGSRLEVFIPSKSRVEFYRNQRILSVQILDFGLQEVDTTAFPQGSYDVDIVINESNGNVIRDRKFFAKAGYLSIRGRPTYDLEFGALRDAFNTGDKSIYQAGMRFRATDSVDLGFSATGTDRLSIGQVEVNALYLENYLRLSASGSTDNDTGIAANISSSILGNSIGFGITKTLHASDSARSVAPTPTPLPGIPSGFVPATTRQNDLYFQDRSSVGGSIRRTINKVDIGYQSQKEQFSDGLDRFSRGPNLEWRIFDGVKNSWRFTSSRYDTELGTVFGNALHYRYRLSPKWSINSQIAYYDREINSDAIAYITLSYDEGGRSQNTTRLNVNSEFRSIKNDVEDTTDHVLTNQVLGDYGGDYVQGRVFFTDYQGDSSGNSAYGVTAETAALISGDGAAAISYPLGKDAVFIADIESPLPNAKFEILFNDQVYDTVRAGKRSAVGVHPFKTYRVYIRPVEGNELVEYDSSTYVITFFPGNVVRKTFKAYRVFIALGRLVDSDGNPIPFQRIRGPKDYVATDEDGRFQAEITGEEKLSVQSKEYNCNLDLKLDEHPQYFAEVGDVICR